MTTSINLDFGSPDFKIAGLESKFDFIGVPNSFVRCFEAELNRFEITVLYQLLRWHSWSNSGVVLRGIKWIYKSVANMIEDAFCGVKPGKLYRALGKLERLGFLEKEQLHREHYGDVHACAAYNRRNYYSPIMEKVTERIVNTLTEQSPQTLSTLGFSIIENQISQNETTDFSKQKNITHTTSTSELSPTPPLTPPRGVVESEPISQNSSSRPQDNAKEQVQGNPESSCQNKTESQPVPFTKAVAKVSLVEQKVNLERVVQKPVLDKADAEVTLAEESDATAAPQKRPVRQRKTPKGTKPSFEGGLAPWNSLEQFQKFYRALIASPYVRRMAKNLEALVNRIVVELKQGVPHPFWDDFIAGREIGSSTRQEWQMPDGSPHPDFIEYLAEKLIRGNNTQTREIAISEAIRIAKDPEQARFFWKECKVSLVNAKKRTERDRALGVSSPVTPNWTHERIEPTVEEAAAASMEIKGINQQTTMAIEATRNPQAQLGGDGKPESIADRAEPVEAIADPWVESAKPPKPKISDYANGKLKAFLKGGGKKSRPRSEKRYAQPDQWRRQPLRIDEMNFAEINKALTDPILRDELTPQLIFDSPYELIKDELGRILRIEKPPE